MTATLVDCALCGLRVEAFRPSNVPGVPGREWFPRPHLAPVSLPALGLVRGAICQGQYRPGNQPTAAPWRPAPCRWTFDYPVGSDAGGGISTNHMYRPTGAGGRVLAPVARSFRDRVVAAVRMSRAVAPPGPLYLGVVLVPPDGRTRDVDGPIKLLQDAICAALELDDKRIAEGGQRRMPPDAARPRIEAELLAIGGLTHDGRDGDASGAGAPGGGAGGAAGRRGARGSRRRGAAD